MSDALPSSVHSNVLHVGLPASPEGIDKARKDGARIVFFVTKEERENLTLGPGDVGVTWISDEAVQEFLFSRWPSWVGWTIAGNDAPRMEKLAKIMGQLVDLSNFDTDSIKFLTRDNEPTKNALRNFRYIDDGIPLARAKGRWKNVPCVIVAAGPSLNEQWKSLKRIREAEPETLFIVCGRVYSKAVTEGVIPQFIIEVEQFEWDDKIWMFAPPPSKDMILAFPLTVCPGVARAWPAERMVMVDHNTASMFGWKIGEQSIGAGNSILHHMVNLALFMGCGPIALAGADLAYPKGTAEDTHADGAFHPWPGDILKNEHTHQSAYSVPSTNGGMVMGSLPYQNFRVFLETQIEAARKKNPAMRFFNFSPNGQLVRGSEYADVATWSSKCLPPSPSSALPSPSSDASSLASGAASSSTTS